MTLNSKSMDWLNHNRHRAFPMDREEWRAAVGASSELDKVILDAVVFDANDGATERSLSVTSIDIGDESTTACFKYGDMPFTVSFSGGGLDGDDSFHMERFSVSGDGFQSPVCVSLAFSSHAYLATNAGSMSKDFGEGVKVMPCRVLRIPDGRGVDYIHVNGSANVQGGGNVSGDVVLEDGYRTMPVVRNGKVYVRVGTAYGIDPCHYFAALGNNGGNTSQCGELMFFFCGQNATGSKSGNVSIKGGPGINVAQGKRYRGHYSAYNGIPCIEIQATSELMELYRPE